MKNERDLYLWAKKELTGNILPFWHNFARDLKTGGFYGFLDNENIGDPLTPRSVVMTARHLWTYSAAFRMLKQSAYLSMADYAYEALKKNFFDAQCGGVYWSVTCDGIADIPKKQIYGEAFAIYALAEYGRAKKDVTILDSSIAIYDLLENHARDTVSGGYVEARSRDWQKTDDLKLSMVDENCEKSMNTNLHVMEAFTCLYRSLKAMRPADTLTTERVGESLSALVSVTTERILGDDGHLDFYFNADWTSIGDKISYGHDIEASWLLREAAEELGDKALLEKIRPIVIRMANSVLKEGWDPVTGALENEFHNGHKDHNRIWWCQAEGLVGFYNAYQMTNDERFLEGAKRIAAWIEEYQKDHKRGDWFASVSPDGTPEMAEPKGGNWKTSYHNARCCMEIMHRVSIEKELKTDSPFKV